MTMLAVKTEVFEGPLDLLLYLIERDDLDITAVSLIQVTDQYIVALRSGESTDFRALADFEYGFPAGLVDPGESVAAAVARELREETGLELTRIVRSGPPVYSSAGLTDESVAMVYVDCQGTPSTAGNQGAELIEVLLVSPAEAERLCREPDLKFDAKAWLVLDQFARFGRI